MINADMRLYDYYIMGGLDEYGQRKLPAKDAQPEGKIKMAISISNQTIQDNILFQGCEYMGFTHDTKVNDTYIIDYNGTRLKVLYVSPQGRFKQVYLTRMG